MTVEDTLLENTIMDISEPHSADTVGVASTNRRLDKVEHDVQVLNTAVATMTTEVRNLYKIQHESSQKLDKLLDQGGVTSATRGMIPVSYVTWAVSAFIAIIAVFLTALTFASGAIKDDIAAGNALNDKEFERLDTLALNSKENINSTHDIIDKEAQYAGAVTDLKIAKLQMLIEKEKEILRNDINDATTSVKLNESRLDDIAQSLNRLTQSAGISATAP